MFVCLFKGRNAPLPHSVHSLHYSQLIIKKVGMAVAAMVAAVAAGMHYGARVLVNRWHPGFFGQVGH